MNYSTPMRTLRKRAAAAPWPTWATCDGWPLPQFGVPHTAHSRHTASQPFQNAGVMPV